MDDRLKFFLLGAGVVGGAAWLSQRQHRRWMARNCRVPRRMPSGVPGGGMLPTPGEPMPSGDWGMVPAAQAAHALPAPQPTQTTFSGPRRAAAVRSGAPPAPPPPAPGQSEFSAEGQGTLGGESF